MFYIETPSLYCQSILVLVFKIKNVTCLFLFPADGYLTLKTKKKKNCLEIILQYHSPILPVELCANPPKGQRMAITYGIMDRL